MNTPENGSTPLPDAFDRALDQIKGLPDVTATKPTTIRVTPTLAIGGSHLFVVQTVRALDQHAEGSRSRDTIFLEVYGGSGQHRLVLPDAVCAAIARQRDSLSTKIRSKTGRRLAAERAERGEVPAFLKTKAKGKAKAKR